MILFILIAIGLFIYTIFGQGWLIDGIREDIQTAKNKVSAIFKNIGFWFGANIFLNIINFFAIIVISFFAMIFLACVCPQEETQYSFEINALKDNLVTEGELHGGMFSMRGYVDGEISYFFSRTMSKGEVIGHIPADKTYIRYDNNVHPCIEVHQSRIDIPKWMYKVFFLEMMNDTSTDYYVIVAPEGTITNTGTYQIDME